MDEAKPELRLVISRVLMEVCIVRREALCSKALTKSRLVKLDLHKIRGLICSASANRVISVACSFVRLFVRSFVLKEPSSIVCMHSPWHAMFTHIIIHSFIQQVSSTDSINKTKHNLYPYPQQTPSTMPGLPEINIMGTEQSKQEQQEQPITPEQEILSLKETNFTLTIQVDQLQLENTNLKNQLTALTAAGINLNQEETDTEASGATATAAAAAQLSSFQSALALSETQKQQLDHENQVLKQRLAGFNVNISDILNSPLPVPPLPGTTTINVGVGLGVATKVDGSNIDITEAEALAAIDQQQVHHHDIMTPNTAGLSSRSEEKWELHFTRLREYRNEHGNCLVPTSTELGRWLCRQRHNYRYKNLKEDRKHRLMELDKTCLGERVAELTIGGEGDVPATDEDGNIIVSEVSALNTKTKYNQAYESKLHAKWDKYFQELVDYKTENGHCNFPTMNGSLGRWISRQRTLYRSKKLKSDRFEKLSSLGFAFEDATALEFKGKLDLQWDDMFQKLMEHKEKKGHCFDVPETWPLGKWLYRQRWLYRHGNLREDRTEKLLGVGFEDKKVLKKDGGSGGSGSARKKRKKSADDDDEIEDVVMDGDSKPAAVDIVNVVVEEAAESDGGKLASVSVSV